MHTPLRAAAFVGRVTAAAAAVASAPVQRGSLRNAQAAIALHRSGAEGARRWADDADREPTKGR